ncbi:MAG: LacI family transcriptional regulator [Fimbriimonadales bacterium]|nr:LacI family transcriptional regulator [Fimbriimonadales bacterium]
MPATIKDIAKRLNVSVSTVSYALNGGPRPVAPELRERILAAAREMDYRPNRLARSLITRRSHILGVVRDASAHDLVASPYAQSVLNGILNEAEKAGRHVLIVTRCEPSDPEGALDRVLEGHADGLIFMATYTLEGVFEELARRGFPFVVLSGIADGAPSLCADNAGGVRQAIEHLHGLGHRRIGHLEGIPGHLDGRERKEAFLEMVGELGLPLRPHWIARGNFEPVQGAEAARAVLRGEDRPTALFCANDEMAIAALAVARELGIRVPDELSIVGFDDAANASLTDPPLTTVRQPSESMGAAAVRALLERIDHPDRAGVVRFPTRLVVRGTTATPKKGTSQ